MSDLRKKISKGVKRMWAEMPPELKKLRLSKSGKKGGTNRWAAMTPKERIALITKMTKARQALYAKRRKNKGAKK